MGEANASPPCGGDPKGSDSLYSDYPGGPKQRTPPAARILSNVRGQEYKPGPGIVAGTKDSLAESTERGNIKCANKD